MTSVAQGQVQRRTKLAPYHLSKLKPAVLANEGTAQGDKRCGRVCTLWNQPHTALKSSEQQ